MSFVKSTLPFLRREGHRYTVGFEGAEEQTVCFNAELNEHPDNVYRVTVSHSGPSGSEDPGEVEPARLCGRNLYIWF
mgnify:CR=1 FL=1